jgi:hypothetical protein
MDAEAVLDVWKGEKCHVPAGKWTTDHLAHTDETLLYNLWPIFVHSAFEDWDTLIVQWVFIFNSFQASSVAPYMLSPLFSMLRWDVGCQN